MRHRFALRGIAPALLLVSHTSHVLRAQDYRAKVQGVVIDTSGGSVAGAKITLRNMNAGTEAAQVSNAQGQYVFNFVEPGTYTVVAELPGFSRFNQTNIVVQTRADVTVNITLEPGSVNEVVSVTASD